MWKTYANDRIYHSHVTHPECNVIDSGCGFNLNKHIEAKILQFFFFSNTFPSMKIVAFCIRFHWTVFPRVQLIIHQHWVRNHIWLAFGEGYPSMTGGFSHKGSVMQKLQSNAIVTRSDILRYYINNCRNWGRISIRCWIHKRHPIPRPNGQAMGCLLWENWPFYNIPALYFDVLISSWCTQ